MKKTLAFVTCAGLGLILAGAFVLSSRRAKAAVPAGPDLEATAKPEPVVVPQEGFEVQVLVNGRPLEEYAARGRTYIEAIENAEYEVRIRNPLPYRVAAALSVDGLNSIDARHTTAWEASKWVIGPYETIHISGWQVSSARARHFYFTTERDSYGAKLGQTANLGVISVVFFRERHPISVPITPPPPPRPHPSYEEKQSRDTRGGTNEPSASSQPSGAAKTNRAESYPVPNDESAATGIGRSVQNDVRWVQMDLESRPAAEVTIRYEYYSALVRLGIAPRPYPRTDSLRRREGARGFENRGFSPEP
jgi:hypothetical protein